MSTQDFLLELGTEEIPARFVETLLKALGQNLETLCNKQGIPLNNTKSLATYRRLAIIAEIPTLKPGRKESIYGPPADIAQDKDGNWLPPAQGFAKKAGVTIDQLQVKANPKDKANRECLYAEIEEKDQNTIDLLPAIIQEAIANIPLPIAMKWGSARGPFFRPVHWIVALFGSEVIDVEIQDKQARNISYGHRFLTQNDTKEASASGVTFEIAKPSLYIETLRKHHVIVDQAERENTIREALAKETDADSIGDGLVKEVTYLVEQPVPLVGAFDKRYLEIPDEVLILSMAKHQKYFPKVKSGVLTNQFVVIADSVTDTNKNNIIKGNEKVLHARLEDCRFFWDEDQKQPLEAFNKNLDNIVFQQNMGTVGDKSKRIQKASEWLFEQFNQANPDNTLIQQTDLKTVQRTATLAKADLTTQMVYELPDLQGVMGCFYAIKSGDSVMVGQGIEEHYMPKGDSAPLPETFQGIIVGIADKLDTIVACYENNLIPTSSKDPHGIRRAMLGIIRTLNYHNLNLDLDAAITNTYTTWQKEPAHRDQLDKFFTQRFKQSLKDKYDADIIEAVSENWAQNIAQTQAKAETLQTEKTSNPDQYKQLVETAVRIHRLAQKANGANTVNESLFKESTEKEAFASYQKVAATLKTVTTPSDAYTALASLTQPMTSYFNDILVMDKDEAIQSNRLTFLNSLKQLYFSQLGNWEQLVIQ
ncbi:glycine--tRNA ligase subunit beta [bacterium]|jgi:glycyl-tRNA synthetase beta chain|nr:glycine--tRNA ligase subunit beta [bacterium]